jgi:D-alanyl-D-alanine carboxypeptidase
MNPFNGMDSIEYRWTPGRHVNARPMLSTPWKIFDDAVADLGVAGASIVLRPGAEPESHWLPDGEVEPAFLAYSITKTFIATLVLQLCEAGQLELDDSLARWFPKVERAERITLRRLLNHSAGIPDYGPLPHYHEAVRTSPSVPWSFDRFASETFERGLAFEPGEGWLYSNPGYMLVRAIIERVSAQTFSQLLTEKIFRPLELQRSFVPETVEDLRPLAPAMSTALAADGSVRDARFYYHPGWVAHGVVASTPSELARFFDALFAGRLLSRASLNAMTDLVPVPAHLAPGVPGKPSYGLGLMGDPTTELGPSWGHNGGALGYQASVQHLAGLGATVCVMAGIEQGFVAADVAWQMLTALKPAP